VATRSGCGAEMGHVESQVDYGLGRTRDGGARVRRFSIVFQSVKGLRTRRTRISNISPANTLGQGLRRHGEHLWANNGDFGSGESARRLTHWRCSALLGRRPSPFRLRPYPLRLSHHAPHRIMASTGPSHGGPAAGGADRGRTRFAEIFEMGQPC